MSLIENLQKNLNSLVLRRGMALFCVLFGTLLLQACGGGDSGASSGIVSPQQNPVAPGDAQAWSNPATWGGTVPAFGTRVTIPAGKTVLLDTNIDLAGLVIDGSLICADRDLNVRARWIMVHGLLQCGTAEQPYTKRLDIELYGNDRNESVMDMGTKFIGAMGGGIISLHGERRTSWLMLNGTINPGAGQFQVEHNTGWRVGDIIVVTSTDDNMHHAEVRQITWINGTQIGVNQGFNHRHFGEVQTFANARRTWKLDSRAEVALLTRNIRIRGDDASENQGFGGHMMIMEGAAGFVSGVELYRMGQTGLLARYPFHWHLTNNAAGQYFVNSVITRSFNRCVTVHGAHNTLVQDNTCYDHLGHGYFLEDGGETGNVFDHNLGILTRRPTEEQALIPSDTLDGQAAKGYDTPNRVGGTSGNLSRYRGIRPVNSRFGTFSDNRVHSSKMAFSSCSNPSGPIGYKPSSTANYVNLTVFSGGDGAVWPCHGEQRFTNMIISDTGHSHHAGFVAPRPVGVTDSLFVANSKLSEGGRGRQRAAFGIYDFGVDIRNSHFVNFDNAYGPSYLFGARESDVRFTNNPVSGLTMENSPFLYDRRRQWYELRPSMWGALIHDEDGSFGLGPGTALVSDHPLMNDNTCTDLVGTGRLCGNRYGRVEIDVGSRNLPPMTHFRSDGVEVAAAPLPERAHYQSIVSVNHNRYFYGYAFAQSVLDKTRSITVSLDFLHAGDTVTLELAGLPLNAIVTAPGYSEAGSFNGLVLGPGSQFYKRDGSIFLKMKAEGDTAWYASDTATISW